MRVSYALPGISSANFSWPVSDERRGIEHARVRQGVRVPRGAADGACATVPGLVARGGRGQLDAQCRRNISRRPLSTTRPGNPPPYRRISAMAVTTKWTQPRCINGAGLARCKSQLRNERLAVDGAAVPLRSAVLQIPATAARTYSTERV